MLFNARYGVSAIIPVQFQKLPSDSTHLVARLTPRGRGAVAVVGVMGNEAMATFRSCWTRADSLSSSVFADSWSLERSQRPYFGLFHFDADVAEEVVVYWRLPDVLEIDCHGGEQASAHIIDTFVSHGALQIDGCDWEVQALKKIDFFDNGIESSSYCPSESVRKLFLDASIALISSSRTEVAAQLACDQPIVWSEWFSELADSLRAVGESDSTNLSDISRELQSFLETQRFNTLRPYVVALVGAPNVGKSSLLNAIIGYERALASPESGSTRDLVGATYVYGGWEFQIVDGAGLRQTDDEIESTGVELVTGFARRADVILKVFDPTASRVLQDKVFEDYIGWGPDSSIDDTRLKAKDGESCLNVRICAMNKSNLPSETYATDWSDEKDWFDERHWVRVSARDGYGIAELLERVYQKTFVEEYGDFAMNGSRRRLMWNAEQYEFLKTILLLCLESRYDEALRLIVRDNSI